MSDTSDRPALPAAEDDHTTTTPIDAVAAGRWGMMTALRGTDIVTVPLSEATDVLKVVDPALYAEAEVFFG